MTTWIELRLITPPEHADVCSQWLMEAGCTGVQIDDSAVLFDASEDATIATKTQAIVTGYLEVATSESEAASDAQNAIEARLQSGTIPAQLEVEPIADQDWSTNWRENFPPLRIGSFVIAPPWEAENAATLAANAETVIYIDPGLAFGTGQHPTTRLCLELLGEYVKSDSRAQPQLLDVGCGSGILSIAAAHLGARVTASDLDSFCVNATRDNAAANDVNINVVQAAGLEWVATQFDFVLANLMSALLVTLAPDLARVTRPNGTLIVSGISAPRAEEVETALHDAGFKTIVRRDLDGEQRGDYIERWVAFMMQK